MYHHGMSMSNCTCPQKLKQKHQQKSDTFGRSKNKEQQGKGGDFLCHVIEDTPIDWRYGWIKNTVLIEQQIALQKQSLLYSSTAEGICVSQVLVSSLML